MFGAKMTANELADALKDMESGWFDDLTLKQAATMLRQQQAEIEALKSRELTLTNEEILEYADAYGLGIGNIYEFGHGQFIAVIRAILRKAQEK